MLKSPEELQAATLSRLSVSPMNARELADELYIKPSVALRTLQELERNKMACRLTTKRDDGPFFCLPGYVEPTAKVESYVARNYSGFYDSPDPD